METPTHYTTPRPEGHIEGFTYFCRTNRSSIFIILSMLLLTYGFMLFHFSFSIDTEACVVLQMNFYKGWIGINRYGLVFTKWLTGLLSLIPGFAAVLMVLTTFGYSLAWMYFFHWIKGRDLSRTELNWVFPVLFFSSVPMVELSNFQCQSFEVAFAMLLCAAALLLEWQWILSGGILRLLLSVMLGVWCFASYQAFVPVYISASLASFLLAYHYRSDEIGSRVFLVSVKLASVFLCDYLICTLLGKILMFLARVEAGTYTDNMIRWGKAPLDEIITSLKLYINDTVLAKNIFWNRWYLFAAVGLLLSAFWKLRKKNAERKFYPYSIFVTFLLLASPFFLPALLGAPLVVRGQLALPFVAAAGTEMIVERFLESAEMLSEHGKAIGLAAAAFLFLLIFRGNIVMDNRLLYSDYVVSQQENALTERLIERIETMSGRGAEATGNSAESAAGGEEAAAGNSAESAAGGVETAAGNSAESAADGRKETAVAILGKWSPTCNPSMIQGETLGHSFYEWDQTVPGGTCKRVLSYWHVLGYEYQNPDAQQWEAAEKLGEGMPAWPRQGSVVREGELVVIKLSE